MIYDKKMVLRIYNLMLDCDIPARAHSQTSGDLMVELFYMLREHIEEFYSEELE
tara:strand:- start:904 stop:1065 length:162 start_codon:yes stop_codon:yes gene_type:complete